jgi:exosortase D (VPLPA-CTERM-specific)
MSKNKLNLMLFVAAIIIAVIAYSGGLNNLIFRWNGQAEYGHGYFIPLISIWFLWNRKEALLQGVGKSSWYGLILVLLGSLGLVLGEVTAIYILIQFGFILTLIGLVLSYGGKSLFKLTFLPIAFLIFAIPLPYFIDAQLSWRLQIISSQLGVAVLRFLGDSVYLEGNVIDLGTYKLQVVEACSGLRYLYPLLSIGFLMAYMYRGKLWQKIFLFLSAIPITVVMNSIRIAMVGILVNKWGPEQADGFVHYFEGWIIFMVCLFILVLEIILFEKFGLKRSFNTAVDLPKIPVQQTFNTRHTKTALILSTIVLIASSVFVNTISDRNEIIPARKQLVLFPLEIDNWIGSASALDKDVIDLLKFNDYLLVDYKKKNVGAVNFYIAYYDSQRKGASPHSPQVCMPGGGWVISSLEEKVLNAPKVGNYQVNRAIINKDNYKQVVYYWFEQRGRHITNQYLMKWYLLLDAIQKNRTDGALIRVTTLVKPGESVEDADKKLQSFLSVAMPELSEFVPN